MILKNLNKESHKEQMAREEMSSEQSYIDGSITNLTDLLEDYLLIVNQDSVLYS